MQNFEAWAKTITTHTHAAHTFGAAPLASPARSSSLARRCAGSLPLGKYFLRESSVLASPVLFSFGHALCYVLAARLWAAAFRVVFTERKFFIFFISILGFFS